MSRVFIGWAEEDITPKKKISLAGQFAERISEYVEKPLTVTAMAVQCGDDQMVIVSTDMPAISHKLTLDVRAALCDVEDLDPEKIMISAIHTHTGYQALGGRITQAETNPIAGWKMLLRSMLKPGQKYVERVNISDNPEIATRQECHEIVLAGICNAVRKAWVQRKPASFANAFDRAPVGMCRRAAYSDNTAQMWGDTNTAVFTELEGGNDSGVELLYCFDENDALQGVVVNLACPAQCVQHRLFVSPDFWGEAKLLIRQRFGDHVFVLPLCSAAGDQCPVDLVRWVEPDAQLNDPNIVRNHPPVRKADPSMFDLQGMRKAGRRVAHAVSEAWDDGVGDAQKDIIFEHQVHIMQLPLRRVTLSEYNDSVKAVRDFIRSLDRDVDYVDVAGLQKYLGNIERYELQERVETIDAEVHVVRMGSIAFATNPFELFLDYGNQIKARALSEQSFLIQLCCGAEGYLPTARAEEHGHYSAFIASGQCGHEGGDLLVRQTLKAINGMFSDNRKN